MNHNTKPRPKVTITCDTILTNEEYSKIRRVTAMLTANDIEVILKDVISESQMLRKTA